MTNVFLKVNKDLFKLGLSPIEILLISQVMEFDTNTGDCYKSDKALAADFGVSEKTISRALSALEARGFIKRETKNIQKGRERHMKVCLENIEAKLKEIAKDKMTVGNETKNLTTDKMTVPQQTNCLFHNGQNDLIKDKSEEDNSIKDNLERDGTLQKPFKVSREWLIERHNYLTKLANGVFRYNNQFYIME